MDSVPFLIAGLNGESSTLPPAIEESYWAALGAGANALCLSLYQTKDKRVVCAPGNNLLDASGVDSNIDSLDLEALQKIDVCSTWRSRVINAEGQPTSTTGEDTPWKKNIPRSLRSYLTLERVLQLFSRRVPLYFILPNDNYPGLKDICQSVLATTKQFGLTNRVIFIAEPSGCQYLANANGKIKLALDCRTDSFDDKTILSTVSELGCELLLANVEDVFSDSVSSSAFYDTVENARLDWILTSNTMPYVPTSIYLEKILNANNVNALLSSGVFTLKEKLQPQGLIFSDDFSGEQIDSSQWALGLSHDNKDTTVSVNNAVIIDIAEGGQYSGGAAVSKLPVFGDFDARVNFHVASPHQGTTFELAAIGIEPSYKKVNLCFDVHGAPPYASSERDEDDGPRCGWNNGFSTSNQMLNNGDIKSAVNSENDATILWGEAYSSNMYNVYGRNVGYGGTEYTSGELRLVRCGPVFNTYYRDHFNAEWVCSGTMLVQSLPESVFLRLAAKHWKKKNPQPPGNTVTFTRFRLYQR